jgi:hypothetical protein
MSSNLSLSSMSLATVTPISSSLNALAAPCASTR